MTCPTCKSEGFDFSRLGQDRCTFCDGTEAGNPPSDEEVFELFKFDLIVFGTAYTMTKAEGKTYRLLPSSVRIDDAHP